MTRVVIPTFRPSSRTTMRILILGLLFFVLSPGVLLTIPPCSKGLFASGQTSLIAAAVHAVVFVIAAHLIHQHILLPSMSNPLGVVTSQTVPGLCSSANDCAPGQSCVDGNCL